MPTYLVDYENRCHKGEANGLYGASNLSSRDHVIVFLGASNNMNSTVLSSCINNSKAQFSFKRCKSKGQNYLDFQLSTYLGYLIGATKETSYYIISSDAGYQAVADYWASKPMGVSIKRADTIKQILDAITLKQEKKREAIAARAAKAAELQQHQERSVFSKAKSLWMKMLQKQK
jgi:hypothetical protein